MPKYGRALGRDYSLCIFIGGCPCHPGHVPTLAIGNREVNGHSQRNDPGILLTVGSAEKLSLRVSDWATPYLLFDSLYPAPIGRSKAGNS